MSVTPLSTPLSFRISEAYGQVRAARAAQAASPADRLEDRTLPDAAQRLVAGVVPGGVEFGSGAAVSRPSGNGSLPFYRNPIAKNEAAVAIALGRSLDVQG